MSIKRNAAVVLAALLVVSVFFMSRGRAVTTSPAWSGLDVWMNQDPEIAELAAQSEELDATLEHLHREIHFSGHLAMELAAGRLSLEEATTRMDPLLSQRGSFRMLQVGPYRGDGTRHKTARYLINRVRQILNLNPDLWLDVSNRLEGEYVALR